jgi:MFS family permease
LHKRAFGLNRLAINLGLTIGPAVGGILASFSYQWLFWIDGLTCIVAALVLWRIFASRRLEQAATETKETKTSRSPWTDPVFLVFIALAIPSFGMFFQIISTYPLFLRDEYRFQEWQIGLLFALNTFVVVFFEMLIVTHMNGWRPLRVIAWGSFFMCEGFAILCLGNGVGLAILSVLGYTLGEMLAMPQGMAFVALRSGEESRSRYIGAYTTCISLSFVIGPIIGAWIYSFDHWLFWRIGLGLGLAVLVGYYALDYFAQSANSPRGQPADAV